MTYYVPGTEEQDLAKVILSLQQVAARGELSSSTVASADAVSLATNTAKNVTSLSLTTGEWDISGGVLFLPAATTSITAITGSVSLVTNTLDAQYLWVDRFAAFVPVNPIGGYAVPRRSATLTATTTVYLVAQATFTVDTLKGYGVITARRVR